MLIPDMTITVRGMLFVDPFMKEFAPELLEELANDLWDDFLVVTFDESYDWDN